MFKDFREGGGGSGVLLALLNSPVPLKLMTVRFIKSFGKTFSDVKHTAEVAAVLIHFKWGALH